MTQHVKWAILEASGLASAACPKGRHWQGMAALPALQRRRRFARLPPVETSDATNWRDTACSHLSTTRWRAETNKLHATLKKIQGEVSHGGEEMQCVSTM